MVTESLINTNSILQHWFYRTSIENLGANQQKLGLGLDKYAKNCNDSCVKQTLYFVYYITE